MSTPKPYVGRPRPSLGARYDTCPHCRVVMKPSWWRPYCPRCHRTFSTGRYDTAR